MRPILTYLFTAGLFCFAFQASGQPLTTTFSPATVNATLGSTVSLQLKVTDFTNITSLQFPITYNSAVLQFTSINNATLPGFTAANYNASAGKVTVSWYPDLSQYPNGYTTAANSTIFTVNFTVLANGSTTVNLANVSPGIEVTRNNNVIQVAFGSGGSNVTGGSGGPGPLAGFHILANTIQIPQGQTACMPVTVNDFTNVVSAAYAMHWDQSVLQYQSTKAYNLPDLSASNFNLYPAGSNTLLMSWFDQNLTGVTRANGTAIYEVCFKAVGAAGSQTMVTIDGTGFPPSGGGAEVINTSSVNIWKNDSGVSDTLFIVTSPPPPDAVTFSADTISVPTGQVGCVEITVKNFTDIISTQLGFKYDATKLQFQSFMFGANPLGLSNANFNPNIPGEIKFTWFDPNALGVDLPDNTVIFKICFTAVGAGGMASTVTFSSLPGFAIEVVKEPGGEVTPALNNGLVNITAFQPPVVQLNALPVSCSGAANGSISTTLMSGTNPTFVWSGPGGYSSTAQNPTGLVAGIYTVTVTVSGGLTTTAKDTVTAPAPLSIPQATPTGATCNGGQNGSIALQTSGGTAPYSFSWAGPNGYTNTTTSTTINNLAAGNYTVTITDSKGCTFVSAPPIQVGQPGVIAVAASLVTVSPVTCFGLTNGAIALPTPSGGTAPFSYSWSGPNGYAAATKNITALASGPYTVTITDNNSCTKSFQFTVNGPSAALSVAPSGTPVAATCFGANNGQASVTVSGGTQPWVVSWRLNSPTGQTIATGLNTNSLVPGNYFPVVTDNNGCTITMGNAIIVGGPTEAIALNQTVEHVECAGEANGSITLAPSGGNGAPFTVSWSGGQTALQISGLSGGAYTPTLTDAKGCTTGFNPITLNEPAPIAIADSTIIPQDGLVLGSITISQVTGGTPPFTYKWSGPNGFASTNQDLTNLNFGIYHLTITDANDCTLVTQAEVKSTNILLLTTVSPIKSSCNDDGCMTFNIPAGAVGPILISLGGNSYVPDADTFLICNLQSGVYQPTISDAAGNAYTFPPLTVPQLQQALVGDSRTNPFDDFKNGSIALNPIPANANLQFLWNTGATTNVISSLDSGTYVVTVTNLTSGCTSVNVYKLVRTYQPFSCLPPQVTQSDCLNTDNGAISINVQGGDGPTYTYQWAGPNGFTASTKNISGILPGTYTLTVMDESNNQRQCPAIVVGSQSQLAVTNVNEQSDYNGFQVSGATVCDGKATVVYAGSSGNASVLWSNGNSGATNTALCGGVYSVTVTDQLGCTAVWSDSLTYPPSIVGSYTITSNFNGYAVSCYESCDGRANVSAVGGIAPYTIKWPSGQLDLNVPVGGVSQASQLCGGDYAVTITDKNQVSAVYVFTIDEPEPLEVEFASVAPFSFASCDGEVIASAPAGVGTIAYTWSTNNGQSGEGPRAENLCAGTVISYVVEDANRCTAVGSFLVPYPADGCMQVRPVITPGQADGNNDYTLITCIESYPENTFEVYNRWGQLVYQTTGYNNGDHRWEGLTASGQLLPDGVYFFVLKFVDDNGNDQELKGYINLLR
ncbi:MAG: gliding motility-associated C-terminal domain-containing protein [Saprospirales bacterium]|nr:gliding motility-associated C-terminal domain-containing protein [Saprospirales bacterium]